jgi:hypothetical protein
MSDPRSVTVRILPDAGERSFKGRFAWALVRLVGAGEIGCTPIDHPGPRWSHYIHKLRRAGLAIETVEERHAGPYPGRHARYVLRSPVAVVSIALKETAT